jgi:hypothetical protein
MPKRISGYVIELRDATAADWTDTERNVAMVGRASDVPELAKPTPSP